MSTLKQKRSAIRSSITRILTYCRSGEADEAGLRARADKLEEYFKNFEIIQQQIEEGASTEKEAQQADEYRAQLENVYYEIKATLSQLPDRATEVPVAEQSENLNHITMVIDQLARNQSAMSNLMERLATNTSTPIPQATVQQMQQNVQLPRIKLPEFDGQYTNWIRFRDLFESLINKRENLSNIEKFEYLQAHLSGDASSLIKHMALSSENYTVAWNLIKRKYDNNSDIKNNYLKLLFDQPSMKGPNASELKRFLNRTNEGVNALNAMNENTEQWNSVLLFNLVRKLDIESQTLWHRRSTANTTATISTFIEFLEGRLRELELFNNKPITTQAANKPSNKWSANIHTTITSKLCPICNADHYIFRCRKFIDMSIDDRINTVKNNNLCFNCLQAGHRSNNCKKSTCKTCHYKHNTMLHRGNSQIQQVVQANQVHQEIPETVNINTIQAPGNKITLLPTAIVLIKNNNNEYQPCRVLIDTGAQATLVAESCVQFLQVKRSYDNTVLNGVGSNSTSHTRGKVQLIIKPYNSANELNITALCLKQLTQFQPACKVSSKELQYYNNLHLADPQYNVPNRIDVILGADVFNQIYLDQRVVHPSGSSAALLTIFGWVVIGNVATNTKTHITIAHSSIDITSQLQQFWQIEEVPENKDREMSADTIIDDTQTVKTLGLYWNTNSDTFKYSLPIPKMQSTITKRKVLSIISRIFDPIGWLAPVTIKMKLFMQKLWLRGLDWDTALPEDLVTQWTQLYDNMQYITHIQVPRWLQFSNEAKVEIHGFADSSELAYAAAIYLKVIHTNGEITIRLITSKTRVAPVKQISVPRLELCACQLLVKLLVKVTKSLDLKNVETYGWTDSTIVLAWLADHPRKWKNFIATRTSYIINVLPVKFWRHISSSKNPADCATRGLSPIDLETTQLWWHGPDQLKEFNGNQHFEHVNHTTDEEIRKATICHVNVNQQQELFHLYSDFYKLLRITATIVRFIKNSKAKSLSRQTGFLTTVELQYAHNLLVKRSQQLTFKEELNALSSNSQLSPKHKLASLTPFLDENGILRVGGRLLNANISYDQMHPIILDKNCLFTQSIIRWYHIKHLHAGTRQLQYLLGLKYCIPSVTHAIRRCVYKCPRRMRFRNKPYQQQMGIFKEKLKDVVQFLRNNKTCEAIANHSAEIGIQWHFIPPAGPNFGGIWEAGVKSAKYHLNRILNNSAVTYEELTTMLCQIEQCLNSRPLSAKFEGDADPLTPAHFLILRSIQTVPDRNYMDEKINRLNRWQYLQQLVQSFWKKWSSEYLAQLQTRPKWKTKMENLKKDEIVFVRDEQTPPCKWPIGKVLETHPGQDGLVRVVTVKTRNGVYKRPVSKLCPLVVDI